MSLGKQAKTLTKGQLEAVCALAAQTRCPTRNRAILLLSVNLGNFELQRFLSISKVDNGQRHLTPTGLLIPRGLKIRPHSVRTSSERIIKTASNRDRFDLIQLRDQIVPSPCF